MTPFLLLLTLVYQNAFVDGNFSGFFQDCYLNITTSNAIVTNSTGVVTVTDGRAVFDVFKGKIVAVNSTINITRSSAELRCVNSTVYAVYNSFSDVYLEYCVLHAGLNEFENVTVNVSAFVHPYPVIYVYNNSTYWKFAGNYWKWGAGEGKGEDKDCDGLSDSLVCVEALYLPSATEPLICEHTLTSSLAAYKLLDYGENPPLSLYEITDKGMKYVGPVGETAIGETENDVTKRGNGVTKRGVEEDILSSILAIAPLGLVVAALLSLVLLLRFRNEKEKEERRERERRERRGRL